MRLSDFDYALPAELVAERPAERRDDARLLVHERASGSTEHARVRDLPRFLRAGDLLVLNDTRVLPARVHGRRASGGRVELLFLEPVAEPAGAWTVYANPARKLHPGEVLALDEEDLEARLVERPPDAEGRPGKAWIACLARRGEAPDTQALLEHHGRMPLPPYIARGARAARLEPAPPDALEALDRERYQTVYARPDALGAVAAPTAGLHLTHALLDELAARGVRRASVTLHVGAGTFEPVEVEDVERHRMHSERFELPRATVDAVAATRAAGGRVVCVGTTSVRVLESVAAQDPEGALRPAGGRTELFLRPGSRFRVTDALLTNFHLPRSTLLMLVSAFAGRERVLALYAEAVERRYRFFSYGDAMLLL